MTPDLAADMRPDDREALRDVFESGQVRRAFDEAVDDARRHVEETS